MLRDRSKLRTLDAADAFPKSIILLFGQQTEPPRSLSRPKNSHVNRRKIEK